MNSSVANLPFIFIDIMQGLEACGKIKISSGPAHLAHLLKPKMFQRPVLRENSQRINIFMAVFILKQSSS